jgi:hypothetical protein
MKLRNIIKKLRPTSVKTKVLAGLVATGIVLTSALTFAGFSPANRPTFDWNNPDQRKGSLNGPVFNSFVNTPYYGDERAFFDSARTDQADGVNAFKDVTSYPTQGTKEVISEQVKAEITRVFGDLVFNTVIPRNVRLAEAPSHGKSIMQYDKWSKGARAYKALAKEIRERIHGENK